MNRSILIACAMSVAHLSLATSRADNARPAGTHKAVLHTIAVMLPAETTKQKEASAYAKDLFGKLERHFAEAKGIMPTSFNTGPMLRSLRWREVVINFTVDEALGDDEVIAKLSTYPFKTGVVWSKTTTVTETYRIKAPQPPAGGDGKPAPQP